MSIASNKYVIGNWKMQARHDHGLKLAREVTENLEQAPPPPFIKTVICPPYTQLSEIHKNLAHHESPSCPALGAQDCYPAPSGPFTGDISAKMLVDLGVTYVILGHSERRQNHGETDAAIRQKVKAATAAGLIPIVCIGEHLAERNEGRAASVLARQIEGSLTRGFRGIVAYEPVWAIGSGITPSREELQRKLNVIHALLPMRLMVDDFRVPVLYGGSVTAAQTSSLFSIKGLDGVLVGSASLEAKSFLDIIRAATESLSSSPS
ncbi:triose-phosphate isomerase [Saccharibacter sp. 17.LH.SD]|uniref:triose-phosphate isomerase n=1 Tax=Saccharibacter sp. 17.LH.SD TaxID=2689393 RepID=UPI00136F4C9E|nr:triose-phosphate isomerase [Saccharibacter sp. 17.LH.SD]MXV44246.1 triose-phosphate isomerase [Saccharibacter sp. 17.LH.SD]